MFTRDGQGPARVGAETTFGSDGFNKNHLSAEGGNDTAGFVLDASRLDTDGYRDHSAARRDQTFAKVNFKPDEDSRMALIYSSLEQNNTQDPLGQTWDAYKHDPRSTAAVAETYNTRKSIDHQQLGMNYERYFGDATLQFNLYAGRRSVVQYLSIPRTVASNSQRGGRVVDFDREFHGGTLRWIQPVADVPGNLTFTVGADYDQSKDDRRGYQNFSGDQLGVKGELRRDEKDTATSLDPYLQAHWEIGNWTSELGLRYSTMEMRVDDHYLANGDSSGSKKYQQATPSLSVMYAFTPDLRGYVSVGKGFETPTQAEMAYAPGLAESFNFGLKPATSMQYEMGVKYRLGERTRLNAAVYEIHTDDEIVVASATDGRTSYRNAGRTVRRGFEASLQSDLSEQWQTTLAYTRTDARYADDISQTIESGNRLPGVPLNNLFGELVWKPVSSISMGVEGQYRSKVYVDDSNNAKAAPAYAVFNWRTRFEQHVGPWTFHQLLRLDNLFARQYVGSVIVGDGNGRYYEGSAWAVVVCGGGVGVPVQVAGSILTRQAARCIARACPLPLVSGKTLEAVRGRVDQQGGLGHQVCRQLASSRRGAEAMPGKAGGQGQARDTGHRADDRVGVGGDVNRAGPGAGDTGLFEHRPGRFQVAHGLIVECRVGVRVLYPYTLEGVTSVAFQRRAKARSLKKYLPKLIRKKSRWARSWGR